MAFSREFYDTIKEFDDFLESQGETIEESYLLKSPALENRQREPDSDFAFHNNEDINIAVPTTESLTSLDYGLFYDGDTSFVLEDYTVNLLSNCSDPSIDELEDDWYGKQVEGLENIELRLSSTEGLCNYPATFRNDHISSDFIMCSLNEE